jgi:hypothetical protein
MVERNVSNDRSMGKKSRLKKKSKDWVKAKPDEVHRYGSILVARYGRFVQLSNIATPEEHAAFLKQSAETSKTIVHDLATQIARLQSLIQKHDPIEIMHRAAYMVLPLFLKYQSENEFTSKESYYLSTLEYLQYLISRTPPNTDGKCIEESEWDEIWKSATQVMQLTQAYLSTRRPGTTPPSEIDSLRFMLDSRRLMMRVRRYPIYFADHLRDSLLPYDGNIREAYGVDVPQLIRGLEEINSYQKTGLLNRYGALLESGRALAQKMQDAGYDTSPSATPEEAARISEALISPAFKFQLQETEEKARLALTSAIFDVTDVTALPPSLLSLLSVRAGESILTNLTGPDHDDLSPLSTSLLHYRPFVERNERYFFFYHSGFEDRIVELIEDDLFARFPANASTMRRRRDDYQEELATNLLASVANPDSVHRNLFYPNPDEVGGITEVDALLVSDDILFIVEIKAGGLSAAASRGAPDSLFKELSETIGTGQRQAERAERYIKSADEVPFFDSSGKHEVLKFRHLDFRKIFRVVITRENLGWVGARIAVLSMLDPKMDKAFPWHVSMDDLRVVAELFKDSELRFAHYLEQRLMASSETALVQHDEIEHIALYDQINHYHELPAKGMDTLTFDPSYMRDIDLYFSEKYGGKSPELPWRKIPPRLAVLLAALRASRLRGRFEAASIILSMDDTGRNQLDEALKHLDLGKEQGRQRSVRLPFTGASYGLTVSYAEKDFDQELIRSAAQMEQGKCARWVVVRLTSPSVISEIDVIKPGRFSDSELTPGRQYLEQASKKRIATESPGRNDKCPCGSGNKFKKCHGR